MRTVFSKEFMKSNSGCYSSDTLAACSFMQSEVITLESILYSEIPLKDKYWFVCKNVASKEENRQIAIGVAEIVLPIYEHRYPQDMCPREAIEAAKQFIAGHTNIETLLKKKRAAADAAYAAYAAAAYAAADAAAAYAADAATYAATYAAAADAADAAAAAAAAADAADETKKELLDYLIQFCLTAQISPFNK